MKTYLIRMIGDNSGNIAGIASVCNVAELFDTVDEYMNPHDLEYLRVTGHSVCLAIDKQNLWINEHVSDQRPPTDFDLGDWQDGDEKFFHRGKKWKTLVQLCGGEAKYWEMHEQVYGVGSRRVAGLMRNGPPGGEA